jgi:transcription antitermination factor NusG
MKLPSQDASWFVIRAKAGWEHLAAEELTAAGFEAYVPRRRKKNFIRRQRLVINHHEPLMPGYLFLGAGKGQAIDWGRLHDDIAFRHVGRPLRGAVGPLRIPAGLVIAISVDEMDGKFDETGATKKANHEKLAGQFAEGTQVRVTEGVFAGFLAMCESVTAQDRVKALVSIFGRLAPVEFMPEQLDKVA